MEEKIQEYLYEILKKKRLSSAEKELAHEISSHIWELYDEYIASGDSEIVAVEKAIKEMGNPECYINQVRKNKIPYRVISIWIVSVLIILYSVCFNGWNIFLNMRGIINKILYIAISLGIIFLVSKMNISALKKNAFPVLCFTVFIDFITTIIQLNFIGVIQENYKTILAFIYLLTIGYVWSHIDELSNKNKYIKYLISIAILLTAQNNKKIPLFVLITGLGIMFIETKSLCIRKNILQAGIICIAVTLLDIFRIILFGKEYQIERLKYFLTFTKGSIVENNQNIAAQIISSSKLFGNIDLYLKNNQMIYHDREAYIFSYIAGAFGLVLLFGILLLYSWQIGMIGKKVIDYPDDQLIGISILGTYIARIIYSLAICFNVVPVSSISLPFMSGDIWILLFDSMCIGYFMNSFIYKRRYG